MELNELTSLVEEGKNLSQTQASSSADLLASVDVDPFAKANFLTALAQKGEVAEEVSGFAKRFRELARNPGLEKWQDVAIDVCGTGGDKIGSFNISTAVVFGLAAAGVPVLKHGNKSITSKCGSANLLEALGVDLMADDETLSRSMEELGFCFMFAPAFHPAFREIMPVRQELAAKGQRSVFNILGPLINPAKPAYQLLGVFSPSVVDMLACTLDSLGLKSGVVAHTVLDDGRGMDELSVVGANRVRGFGALSNIDGIWNAEQFSLRASDVSELLGGELDDNLRILDTLLAGKAPEGLEDTISFNIAAGLMIVGKCDTIEEGVAIARDVLLGGALKAKLADTKDFYAS
ncbi:anthranilate phosphoribosyltransferase [Pelagicoccus sp. SDUM812002]|uniref:anthranilate phosphoribosyltransferase n=1 Tax=Pelagicoccus sp. SDUM812002 TaxID=3041266 RepID=UPI00280EB57A|nr:anthranilate phosphoribosyltransferase [Pelagicoccus sp. SDUM812002]MDQ8185640.1 anthranilate phosphoribosyltransferase [Pelagicoccus sp. SDUM812002]